MFEAPPLFFVFLHCWKEHSLVQKFSFFSCADHNRNSSSKKNVTSPEKNGYIPDETTAIKVAEAVWLPIYGDEIYGEKPFHAHLKNDSIWIVVATVHTESGGTAYAEIQKSNGKI